MKLLCGVACLACAHALLAGTATVEDVLARPGSDFHPPGNQFWRELGDLDQRGLLVEQLAGWEKGLEREPKSVNLLLRVIAGRRYFDAQGDGGGPDEDFPPPLWMRLRREGRDLEASVSSDGLEWKSITRQRLVLGDGAWFGVFLYTLGNPLSRLQVDHISLEGAAPGGWIKFSPKGQNPAALEIKDGALDLRTVGRGSPLWGWFSGAEVTGDGELTVRIADFDSPNFQGEVGLAVRSEPESGAAFLQMTTTRGGKLRYAVQRIPTATRPLWQRLIDLAPADVRYRVGLARATEDEGFYWTAADQYLAALQIDPAKAFELADFRSADEGNAVVITVSKAKKFDQLVPFVDRLKPGDFQDRKRFAKLLRTMAVFARYRNRLDLVAPYLQRAIEANPELADGRGASFALAQTALRMGDAARARPALARLFALPGADALASPDARAQRRAELNASYERLVPPDVPSHPHAPASGDLLLLRTSGLLPEFAAALRGEPAQFGAQRQWDYVRLAAGAAAQLPGIRPDVQRLRRELPSLVRKNTLFPNPPAQGFFAWFFVGPGAREWINEMRAADREYRKTAIDPASALFLCAPDFYAWPETRAVAEDWLRAYASEESQPVDRRVEALAMLIDFWRWDGKPDRAAPALQEIAALMTRQLDGSGELDGFSQEAFRRLVGSMVQRGLARTVNQLVDTMHGRLASVGVKSAALLRAAANFPDSPDPGVVTVWPASSAGSGNGRRSLHFAIEATPPPDDDRDPSEMRYSLGRLGSANRGRPRTVEIEGSADGRTWHPLGTVRTASLTGTWSGELPAADSCLRATTNPAAAASAAVVRRPAGRNLLPDVAARGRPFVDGGEQTLVGWNLPTFSTVHVQPGELGNPAPMVTWVAIEDRTMQTLASDPMPVERSRAYQLAGWLRSGDTGAGLPSFGLRFLDAAGKEIGAVVPRVRRIPTWQYAQLSFGPGTPHPFPDRTASAAVIVKAAHRVDFSELSLCAD